MTRLALLLLCLVSSVVVGSCPVGQYARDDGRCYSCMRGSYSNQTGGKFCRECPMGAFASDSGSSACASCESGSFQYSQGASACLLCQEGTSQPLTGMTVCTFCPAGAAQSLTGAKLCLDCEPGHFAWGDKSVSCEVCPAGAYQPSSRATACLACPAGEMQLTAGAAGCQACPIGYFQPGKGGTSCDACWAGTYQQAEAASSCEACPAGTAHALVGQASIFACDNCVAGTFSSTRGSSSCPPCPAGAFQDRAGRSGCNSCRPGSFQELESATSCSLCEAGTISTGIGASEWVCQACRPGEFARIAGLTACAACPAGSFQAQEGRLECQACGAGSYAPLDGSSECLQCSAGKFSTGLGVDGSDPCTACGAGSFSTSAGSAAPESCSACPLGSFSAQTGDSCIACGDGTFCPEGSPAPVRCVDFLDCNGTHMEAHPGFLPLLLGGNCTVALVCPAGTRCSEGSQDKGLLEISDPRQTHFTLFADGPLSADTGCGGRFAFGWVRVDWPFHATRQEGVLFRLAPTGCRPGFYLLDTECRSCPQGTFSTDWGALAADACVPCGAGSFSDASNSTQCTACPPGATQQDAGMRSCEPCPPGAFSGETGGTSCSLCPPGTHLAVAGGSTCELCAAGQFQARYGSSECSRCNSSVEFSSSGDSACSWCGAPPSRPAGCSPAVLPANQTAVWIQVTGKDGDECAALDEALGHAQGLVRARVFRLRPSATCRHTLRVAGSPGLSSSVVVAPARDAFPPGVRVIPHNRTFYPALCTEEGFGVMYVSAREEERVWFDILDPTGKHLLYHGHCQRGACSAARFCPTMDVLVRVSATSGAQGTALLAVGGNTPCPPAGEWLGSIELQNASRPHLPGSVLRFDVRVLNPPGRLLAFKLVLKIRPGFAFQSFRTGLLVEQALAGDTLTVTGDASGSVLVNGLLGGLELLLEGRHAGVLRAVRVQQDGLQFMLGQQGKWFSVGVRGEGFSCLHNGFVDVLADYRRPTALIVRAQSRLLVYWRAVQAKALAVSSSLDVWAVWNTRGRPRRVLADCKSLTPGVLQVDPTCAGITARGGGAGRIRVRYLDVEEILDIRVLEPTAVHTRFSPDSNLRSGRLQVLASLFPGHVLDITPFVLTGPDEDILACPADFAGNITVGQPPLFRWECAHNSEPLEAADTLYLLAGDWSPRGAFRLRQSLLVPDSDAAGAVLFRQGRLVRPAVALTSDDASRATLAGGNSVRLVREGRSPRCVALSDGRTRWLVAVLPPTPASLEVQLSSAALVVQQDLWKLVPSKATITGARLWFSDHTWTDVGDRLHWLASSPLLQVKQGYVETLYETGVASVGFALPDVACVRANASVSIHASSVVSTNLTCPACPPLLAERLDPLSQKWPHLFPSAVPIDRFVVRRVLVDGTTHDALEPLQVTGTGKLDQEHVVAGQAGALEVSTAFTQQSVTIPVIRRWAVDWSLLCNRKTCDPSVKLAPPDNGASLAPFRYLAQLSLSFQLVLYNGTVRRFDLLPDVSLTVNGKDTRFPVVPLLPGALEIAVTFGPDWLFPGPETSLRLHVHALASLRLDAPPVLRQLHCSRLWERGPVSLSARLTDGVEARVTQGRLTTDGAVLRVDQAYLEVLTPGDGWVNASFAGMHARAEVRAVTDSLLFTHLSLDGIPDVWDAPVSTRLALNAALSPVVAIRNLAALFERVVRWRASPPGIVDFLETQELVLRSDHFEPVVIQAVIRSCQGASPIVFSKPVQVNAVPDQPWQVDFGEQHGSPLPAIPAGGQLAIPVYLFCAQPLSAYTAIVSVPGLGAPFECSPGELPFSRCGWRGESIRLSGSFPASQHTGRIHLGTVRGTVLLSGLTRLRVSVDHPGNTTFEFAVRLGAEPVHSLAPLANSVLPGFSEAPLLDWQTPAPLVLSVCCDLVASRQRSNIEHLVASSFCLGDVKLHPGGAALDLFDPRLQVEHDPLVLAFDPATRHWTVLPGAYAEVTGITLHYRHPRSLERLRARLTVVLAEPQALLLSSGEVVLKRVHCSGRFQTSRLNASLLLKDGTRLALAGRDLENITVDPSIAALGDSLQITGVRVGEAALVLSAFGLTATTRLRVLDESVVLLSSSMPDPYVLTTDAPLHIGGELQGGERLLDAAFLAPTVTISQSAVWRQGLVVPVSNTHPIDAETITAVMPACQGQPALVSSSRLVVRLQARLDQRQTADIVADSSPAGFSVTLAADYVSAFLIHLHTGPTPVSSCSPGQDLPPLSDCVIDGPSLLLAGAFDEPRKGPVHLAFLAPMPGWVDGHIEFFSGLTSCVRLPVVAGRFGNVSGPMDSPGPPAVDPASLSRLYARALAQPWDQQAMRDTRFGLQMLVGRQRLVDARLYSNELELSAMFRVLDRFLQPDASRTAITVTLHSRKLPPHPLSTQVPDGVSIPALHVVDGWYAAQWVDPIPHLRVRVSFTVSTSTSSAPWEHVIEEPLVTGRPLHECPRLATDRASFLVLYRIPAQVSAASLACAAQVAPRRVTVSGSNTSGTLTASVALESFIRMQRAHLAISGMYDAQRQARRLLEGIIDVQRVGLLYINDTADPAVPCPPGTYYSQNGTYERLPLHATVGPECYGMSCVPGYALLHRECVPSAVSPDLAWVCVSVILALMLLVSCVLCALHMGRRTPPPEPVDLASDSWADSSHPSEPFVEDDTDHQFKNILLGSYVDDYSREILDDEFASIPFDTRLPESWRQASK